MLSSMQEDKKLPLKVQNRKRRKAESVLINLLKVIDLGNITIKDVEAAIKMAHNNTIQHLLDLYDEEITKDAFGKNDSCENDGATYIC